MTTLNTRFVAYLPLLQPSMPPDPLPSAALVAETIRRDFPTVPMQIMPAGVAGDSAYLLTIDSTVLSIMLIDKPSPRDAYALAMDRIGPETTQATAAQQARNEVIGSA